MNEAKRNLVPHCSPSSSRPLCSHILHYHRLIWRSFLPLGLSQPNSKVEGSIECSFSILLPLGALARKINRFGSFTSWFRESLTECFLMKNILKICWPKNIEQLELTSCSSDIEYRIFSLRSTGLMISNLILMTGTG
jgi:hypothetical protein